MPNGYDFIRVGGPGLSGVYIYVIIPMLHGRLTIYVPRARLGVIISSTPVCAVWETEMQWVVLCRLTQTGAMNRGQHLLDAWPGGGGERDTEA